MILNLQWDEAESQDNISEVQVQLTFGQSLGLRIDDDSESTRLMENYDEPLSQSTQVPHSAIENVMLKGGNWYDDLGPIPRTAEIRARHRQMKTKNASEEVKLIRNNDDSSESEDDDRLDDEQWYCGAILSTSVVPYL